MITTFAFLSFLFHVSFQQLDVALMENNLQSATNLIIAKEKKVSSTILSCRANAAMTSSNFKAINASKIFTNSFDAMANLTVKLHTVKEFESFTKCDNLTTCECISFRSTLCDAQVKEIDGVAQSIYLNASLFYQTFNDIILSYMLDYKPIQFRWTREVAVLKTFNQSKLVMNELSDLNRVIFEIRKYFINAMDYLESQSLNCSARNSTFFEEGNLIEDKLRAAEDKLLNLTIIALENVNISLNTVASSAKKVKATITAKSALGSLKSQLEKQKTCKDYRGPKVSWPRIPDTTGRATGFMKVRTCKAKKESYSFTKNSAAVNKTKIKNDLDDFENSSGSTSSSIQKRSITLTSSSLYIDVITAVNNILDQFDVYIQELNLSIARVDNMERYYDQYTCGVFVPYDPVNDINGPAKYGFPVGTYYDGNINYVGHAFSKCGGQTPCPARVVVSSSKFGGYTTCGNEYRDKTTAYYLLKHPGLYWIPTNSSDMMTYNNTLNIITTVYKFMYGRVKNGSYAKLGKVPSSNGCYACFYSVQGGSSEASIPTGYEVLACKVVN